MMFRTYTTLLLTMFVVVVASTLRSADARSMRGGWSSVESPNEDEIIIALARFATDIKYVDENVSIRVVECHRQLGCECHRQEVAGLRHDMKVEVTNGANVCKVEHYEIWDRFGEKRVIISETTTGNCF